MSAGDPSKGVSAPDPSASPGRGPGHGPHGEDGGGPTHGGHQDTTHQRLSGNTRPEDLPHLKALGARVRALRIEAGVSGRQLSQLMGDRGSGVSKLELGQGRVSRQRLEKVARALATLHGLPVDALVDEFVGLIGSGLAIPTVYPPREPRTKRPRRPGFAGTPLPPRPGGWPRTLAEAMDDVRRSSRVELLVDELAGDADPDAVELRAACVRYLGAHPPALPLRRAGVVQKLALAAGTSTREQSFSPPGEDPAGEGASRA